MSIHLSDDGTLDTVLKCPECGEEFRYSERYRVLTAVGYKPGAFERGPDLETVAPTYHRELVGGGWNASDMLDAINAAYKEAH